MADQPNTEQPSDQSAAPVEIREVLAFEIFADHHKYDAEGTKEPAEQWRQDEALRKVYREKADRILRMLGEAGLVVRVGKRSGYKPLSDYLTRLQMIPARVAYTL